MKTFLVSCVLASVCMCANAQRIETPILSISDSVNSGQAFHLVSQTPTVTVIEFDGLAAPMHGSVIAHPDQPSVSAELHAEQFLTLFMAPSYTLSKIFFSIDLYAMASGASYTDPNYNYFGTLSVSGASGGTTYLHSAGRGAVDGTMNTVLFSIGPMGQAFNMEIDLDASMHVSAAPWAASSATIFTRNVRLELVTEEITPVPEPASLQMLLAGLTLLGLAVRCGGVAAQGDEPV